MKQGSCRRLDGAILGHEKERRAATVQGEYDSLNVVACLFDLVAIITALLR